MMTRKVISDNLQRNAHSIARLAGEQGNQKAAIEKVATPELMQAIEQLTSLYAFQKLDTPTKGKMAELVKTEDLGMRTLIGTLQAARAKEQQRRSRQGAEGDIALKNGWQGYVPSLTAEGASVIVEDVSEEADLIRKGYVRIGAYQGDRRSGNRGKRAYYQSTVSGQNAFRQGVAQTVHESYQGVDSRTGRNKSEETGELVLGQRANAIAKDIQENGSRNNLRAGEYLLPIYDAGDNITGFEESLDPGKLVGLQKDQHLGRMLGVWLGRIEEESMAHEANKELVGTLKGIYDKEYALNPTAFINVADKKLKDPVYKDAWGTLGWKIKQDAAEIFGRTDFLPIRKDMIDDAIGYRAASLTDSWTGISRLNPEHQERIKRVAIRPGLRVIGFERRVSIAFSVQDERVTILRIFYGGRNWEEIIR